MDQAEERGVVEEGTISKLQALFRGRHSRAIHVKRKQDGAEIVCPFVSGNSEVFSSACRIANIGSSDVVVDLGCGDGAALVYISLYTGAKCIGYEIDPVLSATARRRLHDSGTTSFDIYDKDIYTADLSVASVVYIFLVPSAMKAISSLLLSRAAPGTRVVSYMFPLPSEDGWEPVNVEETSNMVNTSNLKSVSPLYFYIVRSVYHPVS